jgi:phosphonopyruvate decarboxylase
MSREEAIGVVADGIGPDAFVVSTTGMASRELFEHRVRNGQDRSADFLTVGSMGHASQIALGVSLSRRDREVYCLDGDGAVLMHMGGLATLGALAPPNFKHVVLNNGAHDSVGGQPTVAFDIDLPAIFRACGYRTALRADTREDLLRALKELGAVKGPAMVEVRVRKGARADLGRPTSTPRESKEHFMRRLSR